MSSIKATMVTALFMALTFVSAKGWGVCLVNETRDEAKTFLTKFNHLKQPDTFTEEQWDLLINSYKLFCHNDKALYYLELDYQTAGPGSADSIARMYQYFAELKRTSIWVTDSVKKRKPIEHTKEYFQKWVVYAHMMAKRFTSYDALGANYKVIIFHIESSDAAMKELHSKLD